MVKVHLPIFFNYNFKMSIHDRACYSMLCSPVIRVKFRLIRFYQQSSGHEIEYQVYQLTDLRSLAHLHAYCLMVKLNFACGFAFVSWRGASANSSLARVALLVIYDRLVQSASTALCRHWLVSFHQFNFIKETI